MSRQAANLIDRINQFNSEVIAFVEKCSDEDWKKVCASEDWPVGVVARHIGAGHYSAMSWIDLIVQGKKMPEMSEDQVISMANQHAAEHADCTREEVLQILRERGRELVDYIARLDESDFNRTGYLSLIGKDVSAGKLIEMVVLQSGGEHFASMKSAVAA
jgi:uncharacterized damage-inducible protein DinB